jgi:rod shape-determining protein MreC
MSKRVLSLLTIVALFVGAFKYSNTFQEPILNFLNNFKSFYLSTTEGIENGIEKHFYQAQQIELLQKKLALYEDNHLIMQQLASNLEDLYDENNASLKNNPKVALVRSLSYESFGNMNRLWLEVPDYNSSKIYGLVYNELVAGIVIDKDNMPLALLNKDRKSTYAVSIGKENAPGIANGKDAKNIAIKFIPAWFHIKVGDEVTTSGLDQIFFKGLKVGKVLSISSSQGFQSAIVKPYFDSTQLTYFHIIKSTH